MLSVVLDIGFQAFLLHLARYANTGTKIMSSGSSNSLNDFQM
jgi:hypothetical protein